MTISCPCCSGMQYESCCEPFHQGKIPENALELMRSRYSAYALNKPEYLVVTTHPASPHYSENSFSWKRSISKFCKEATFHKLQVHDFQEHGLMATVTFTAFISREKENITFTECSYFEKYDGRWLYRSGTLEDGFAPDIAHPAPFRVLPLAYLGDPILHKKAENIHALSASIHSLVEEMVESMDAYHGIGLAAPQVHHSLRLFVIRKPIDDGSGGYDAGPVKVFINPTLHDPSEETWKEEEACLSIPNIHANVERPREISIEYVNISGDTIRERLSGWEARVIMHEYDHIDGVLFIDRLPTKEQTSLEPTIQRIKRRLGQSRNRSA